jgi:hypothetical protein
MLKQLVMDDYFALNIDPIGLPVEDSFALTSLERARAVYQHEGLLGSPENTSMQHAF